MSSLITLEKWWWIGTLLGSGMGGGARLMAYGWVIGGVFFVVGCFTDRWDIPVAFAFVGFVVFACAPALTVAALHGDFTTVTVSLVVVPAVALGAIVFLVLRRMWHRTQV